VIDQVEVDDAEIRIIDRKSVLERLVMGSGAVDHRLYQAPRVGSARVAARNADSASILRAEARSSYRD
jgi:hypothetical protein